MACKCISKKASKIGLCITLPILAISIVVLALFPTLYNVLLDKELTLAEGTPLSSFWMDIPLPIYEKLFFFNITNKESFLNGSEPLNVTEVGPYVYRSKFIKPNPQWNSNKTVSYREIRTYQFVPDVSNGTEEDLIYTLNGPMIIASNVAKDYDINLKALLSVILGITGEDVVIKRSIKQLVYEGYEDIIIKFAPILKPDIPFKNGVFSWLYGKNATDDGLFTVFTGVGDSSKLNFLNSWNGEDKLKFWKGDTCNSINGTNMEFGPPIHGYQETYTFFQSIFCRSVTFNYTEDRTHFDMRSKRFRPTYDVFANSTENPDNHCFEIEKERPSGILDVGPCQFGAPAFLSFPHFYMADPSYLTAVNGLNPNDEEHGSYLDVEMVTGCTIDATVRFQINLKVGKIEGIFQTYNISTAILPVFWAELNLEMDEHLANFMKSMLIKPKIIAYSLFGALTAICLTVAIVLLVALCVSESVEDMDDRLIDVTNEDCGLIKNSNTSCDKTYGYNY